ncbi:MAG: ADP compounds hydrolase NudE [Gammaproteobacteria bacterium]|nr:ADP compounds hydrolase NudE [Gammaproteobacteria bacterium]
MPDKPKIINVTSLTKSKLFHIQQVALEFSSGKQAHYERILAAANGAVLIVPLLANHNVLMIREYSVGTDQYELLFPKGLIDDDESILCAANRELMEETGYAARQLNHINTMTIAPGYLGFKTHIILAEDLYPEQLEGDEPEPLEVLEFSLNDIDEIVQRDDLTESRTIAALYMVRDILSKRTNHA